MLKQICLSLLIGCMTLSYAHAAAQTAPISGFAHSFILGSKLADGTVTVLETGFKLKTNSNGDFGPFYYPVGKPITLEFSKWGYKTTRTATVMVPPEGLTDAYNNITFQIPSLESYYLLAKIIGAKIDDNSCHLTATVTGYHKTMSDLPQGEADVTVAVTPAATEKPFYFGIFKNGPLKDKTNPFAKDLVSTSHDGGIAFFNLPISDKPYKLIAHKNGVKFSEAEFKCDKDVFINISPPRGPMRLKA
jgi:hypothetical protein